MNNNIFTSFLELLTVKYTKSYSSKLYNEHPHKYNMYGLSQMLDTYNIDNSGINIKNKAEDLFKLDTPFIAHIGSDFVIVNKMTENEVSYIWNSKDIHTQKEQFINIWTGKVLLGEINENSREPDYKENFKKELFKTVQKYIVLFAIGVITALTYIYNNGYTNLGLTLSLTINLCGVYIGYLLTLKQLQIHSEYGDKICSLFKQHDCNNILESDAAKLGGVIGWSEIGLGYFISNLIILLFMPQFVNYLALINICSLIYTFWSIWYQKFKAKQWCILCLIVQVLLWITFFINLGFGFIKIPAFTMHDVLYVGCIYTVPMLIINMLTPLLGEGGKVELITRTEQYKSR